MRRQKVLRIFLPIAIAAIVDLSTWSFDDSGATPRAQSAHAARAYTAGGLMVGLADAEEFDPDDLAAAALALALGAVPSTPPFVIRPRGNVVVEANGSPIAAVVLTTGPPQLL